MDRHKQPYISIGKIVSSHGVNGFAKILPLTDFPERFEELKKVFIFKDEVLQFSLDIQNVRYNNDTLLIKFKQINTPEEIKTYNNFLIKIPYEEIYDLPEDSFYIDELKGIQAYSTDGHLLGQVIEVYQTANDILEIKTPDKKEVMVPFLKEFIEKVDIRNKKVIIKLIPGLFDDQFEED